MTPEDLDHDARIAAIQGHALVGTIILAAFFAVSAIQSGLHGIACPAIFIAVFAAPFALMRYRDAWISFHQAEQMRYWENETKNKP